MCPGCQEAGLGGGWRIRLGHGVLQIVFEIPGWGCPQGRLQRDGRWVRSGPETKMWKLWRTGRSQPWSAMRDQPGWGRGRRGGTARGCSRAVACPSTSKAGSWGPQDASLTSGCPECRPLVVVIGTRLGSRGQHLRKSGQTTWEFPVLGAATHSSISLLVAQLYSGAWEYSDLIGTGCFLKQVNRGVWKQATLAFLSFSSPRIIRTKSPTKAAAL